MLSPLGHGSRHLLNRRIDIITKELLDELFTYDRDKGKFYHRKVRKGVPVAGVEAGCVDDKGYTIIGINKKTYKAHRLVWLYEHGDFPKEHLDHINHNRSDNRICNLREAAYSDNAQNKKLSSRNKSGATGVHWKKSRRKWEASIKVNNEYKYLGYYVNFDDAVKARKDAEKKYGFHENHGKK